jgi:YD repeat-containing protein
MNAATVIESPMLAKCRSRSAVNSGPRLGFVGVGWIGLSRLQAARQLAQFEVVAVADGSAEAREKAAAVAPDAVMCADLHQVLDEPIDGVVIATPSALHARQTCQALEAGKAVFCQKPLARTAEETRRVIGAAQRADRLLGVDFSYRFMRGVAEMRDFVRRGELGTIFAGDLVFHNAYGPDKPWFYDARQSGGGCLVDLGTHLVDLAQWTMGYDEASNIICRLFRGGQRLDAQQIEAGAVEDFAQASWTTETGAAVRLTCSWRLSAGCDAVIEASFYGERGAVRLRNVGGSFYDFTVERMTGTAGQQIASPPDEWGGRCLADWCRRLACGERYDSSIESVVDVAEVLDQCYGRT